MKQPHKNEPWQGLRNERRAFLKKLVTGACGAAVLSSGLVGQAAPARAAEQTRSMRVWSCGGLAETMCALNTAYEAETGVQISYTGANAGALGKSLLGNGSTEVFAARGLDTAQKLRAAGRMKSFMPLCFTSYVIVTPKGNPAGIQNVADLGKPGIRVSMAEGASAPGGAAAIALLKKAGVLEKVKANLVENGTCILRSVDLVCHKKADAMIVERRITKMPRFGDYLDLVEIPEELFLPRPLTFTVGIMEEAQNPQLAMHYATWIAGQPGSAFWERGGFIPACSEKGRELVEKFHVYDHA